MPATVKNRVEGGGDDWANGHRAELGPEYKMQDVDALMGHMAFAFNTGDRLFLEYEPDTWKNRLLTVREFAVVAVFDRKRTAEYAMNEKNRISTAFYLWLCRKLGMGQPVRPKFFFVCGEGYPYQMLEVDVDSGEIVGKTMLECNAWVTVWEKCGLADMRNTLKQWILSK